MTTQLLDRPIGAPGTERGEIVAALTRRQFLGAGVATAALGIGMAAVDPGTAWAAGTRRVPSVHGMVTVPSRPRRVVTTDGFSMATMFDLGTSPVGVYSAGEQYVEPQYLRRWRALPKISGGAVGGPIDIEKVAQLDPDLIIGIDAQKPPYADLRQIAPTVILAFDAAKVAWRDMAVATALTINRVGALAALQREYRAKAVAIKHTYAAVLARTRWDAIQGGFDQGQYSLYGPSSDIGGILTAAGVRLAHGSASATGSGGSISVSYEEIGKLADADVIFYYATNAGKPANDGPALFAQPLFEKLPAVEDGHCYGSVYFLPSSYGDAIGALDSIESALEKLRGGK